MRNAMGRAVFVLALGLVASFCASADDSPGRDLTDIRDQQLELRAEAQAGEGVLEDMSAAEREELVARQSRLLAMIEGKDNVNELDDQGQVEAFNLLEQINATINDVQGQQMVCELTRKTGSHRKTKVCMTVAEREMLREDSGAVMEKAKNGLCFKSGGSCGG